MTSILKILDTNIIPTDSLKRPASKGLLNKREVKKIAVDFRSLGLPTYHQPLRTRIRAVPLDVVPLIQSTDTLEDLYEKLKILTTQIHQELTRQPPIEERTIGETRDLSHLCDLISQFFQRISELGAPPHNFINIKAKIIAGICEKYLFNGGQSCQFSIGPKTNTPQGFLREQYNLLMQVYPSLSDAGVKRSFLDVMSQIAFYLPEDQLPILNNQSQACGTCAAADHLLESLLVPHIEPNHSVAQIANTLRQLYTEIINKHGAINQGAKAEGSDNQPPDQILQVILDGLSTIIRRIPVDQRSVEINIRIISLCNLSLKSIQQGAMPQLTNRLLIYRANAVLAICDQTGIIYSPIFLVQTYRSLNEIFVPSANSEIESVRREVMGDLALHIPTLKLGFVENTPFTVCGTCAAAINHLESLKLSENPLESSRRTEKLENDFLKMDHQHQACRLPWSILYDKLQPSELLEFPEVFRPIQNVNTFSVS